MSRIFTVITLTVFILLPLLVVHTWRVRAANEAAQYAPTYVRSHTIPAGTSIQAIVIGGIAESARRGDPIVAVVSRPVTVDGEVAIPSGSQLKGELETLSDTEDATDVRMRLTTLHLGDRILTIHTELSITTTDTQSDSEAMGAALKALVAGGVGAAVGAAIGDKSLVQRGVVEGARMLESDIKGSPVTVTLLQDVTV